MNRLCRLLHQHRWLVVPLCLLTAWLAFFRLWSHNATARPLDVPISLSAPSAVRQAVEVRGLESESLMLLFERGDRGSALTDLVGNWGTKGGMATRGVPVPLRWTLKELSSGTVKASGDVESTGTAGWSDEGIFRNVATVRVPPGRYVLQAEVTRSVPEFGNVTTRLVMSGPVVLAWRWQSSLLSWGYLVTPFIVLPTTALLALVLLWRLWRGRDRTALPA